MTLFVDTSTFYAAVDAGDIDHGLAKRLLATHEPMLTTDHVLLETWLLIQRRLGHVAAEHFWRGTLPVVDIEMVQPADLEKALEIGAAFADQGFSIVDRTSFAVMLRLGTHRVASLDKDFAVFRFGPRRDRAFEIVR